MASANLASEIGSHLAKIGLAPTPAWLNSFLSSQRTAALQPLKQTAQFRILHSDIRTSLQKSSDSVFPSDVANGEIQERRIAGPITVQILDIEDIGRSRWSQAESLEAEERGEKTKGREIIRVVPGEDDDNPSQQQSTGPHKLVVQDALGTTIYAIELLSVSQIDLNTSIGAKLLLKDVTVARGCLLLEPKNVTFLGGKIDDLHRKWREGRKEALKAAARSTSGSAA